MSNHSWRQSALFATLLPIARTANLFVLGETGIELNDAAVRTCDLALVQRRPETNRLFRASDILLVVEVAETTLARDMGDKRIDCAAAGIPHYWVVDGARSVMHVYADPIAGD